MKKFIYILKNLIQWDFIKAFITPIVVCSKRDNRISFYTLKQYNEWGEKNSSKSWNINYYKCF